MVDFAQRMSDMSKTAKVVRGLFNSMTNPEVISFSGGAPANESLPIERLREISNDVFTRESRGVEAFQYCNPSGLRELREIIAKRILGNQNINASADDVLILGGGLEAMNLVCQVFINPGDVILVESPTFVQSLEIFEMFQAKCVAVDMDENGIIPEDLEKKIKQYNPKMIYVIPTFQNPTGKTLSKERREWLADIGSRKNIMILEDDPYQDLRYDGEKLLPIKAYDKTGNTILANSFSKNFSPGARLGYVYADHKIIEKIFDAKTATNSHTNAIAQVLCSEFIKRGYFEENIKKTCKIYKERRDIIIQCIDKYLPKGTKRVVPDGGIFTWVELPDNIDTTELLKEAEQYKVAFLPGEGFFADGKGKGKNCMRIGFGNIQPEKIEQGIKRLGELIASRL
ncbi:PLP-dependent aminotransferase family protein [Lachnospiraceae bacterium NSJ-143]|nr:PLP-dependent aminotransferase family protein [Lachnospiraceae bacterium NSJ-143]